MKASFWTRLFDLVTPRLCPVCGSRLAATESVLCAVCHLHLPLTGFERSPEDNEMARRFWGLIPIERAAAYFFYEPQSPTAQIIYDLKYHDRPDIGEHLGRIIARDFDGTGFFCGIDAIVPVPLSWLRRWHRGYNQSLQIARGVARVTGLPIDRHVVKRLQFRQSQTHLNVWERRENTSSAFRLIHPEAVRDRHLLLIDDIVTTGSTIVALAQELQQAGAVRFSVLSLGYTKS